jgi:hypothetical protein
MSDNPVFRTIKHAVFTALEYTIEGLFVFGSNAFAVACAGFGLQHLLFAVSVMAAPGPPFFHVSPVLACVVGVILLAAGIGVFIKQETAYALAAVFLLYLLLGALPALVTHIRNPAAWTACFEFLALCGAAIVAAASGPETSVFAPAPDMVKSNIVASGMLPFCLALIVLGVQELIFAPYVTTLLPAWIPLHLFWAYFLGIVTILGALSILTRFTALVGAPLLGLVFLIWMCIVQVPRVVAAPHNPNEWTSLLIAFAMAGGTIRNAA